MLVHSTGNLWDYDGPKVITVNCVGVMGAGLALQCKQRHPNLYASYRDQCRKGLWKPGMIQRRPENVILAATKDDWRRDSAFAWVEAIAHKLAALNVDLACPLLGGGLGSLPERELRQVIEPIFEAAPATITLYGVRPTTVPPHRG